MTETAAVSGNIYATSVGLTTFVANNQSSLTQTLYWMAIGN
jgi:hypothetical protein